MSPGEMMAVAPTYATEHESLSSVDCLAPPSFYRIAVRVGDSGWACWFLTESERDAYLKTFPTRHPDGEVVSQAHYVRSDS